MFYIGEYSNGKKTDSKSVGRAPLKRHVGVRVPPPQFNFIERVNRLTREKPTITFSHTSRLYIQSALFFLSWDGLLKS